MVRLGAFLIGLFMAGWLLVSAGVTTYEMITEPSAATAEHMFHKHPKEVSFAHDGPFGKFNNAQLQRGFKVYTEVCSACHSMNQISFRNLADIGYSEDEVKAIAKAAQVPSINPETGEPATRPGIATDKLPSPYPNETAARAANNNALPPDLSLMTKARHDGPAYVFSLLTGYQKQPVELVKRFPDVAAGSGADPRDPNKPAGNLHYNPYYANLNIAMNKPLSDGQVTFDDGSKNDVKSMSKDVAAFLTWTAEPKLAQRKSVGWVALIFLIIATGLAFLSYRQVWAGKEH
jgi:ubiquinol-cytochrome c reductase cytochrome c1 subunit